MSESITLETGTTVSLREVGKDTLIIVDAPDAPADMRGQVAGRIVEGPGFQPAPFAAFALRPSALRAIADLVEGRGK